MKKIVALILLTLLVFSMAGFASARAAGEETELVPLKVAVMPMHTSSAVYYIVENNLDEAYGLDIEMVLFSSGATMNEALASGQFDCAPIGGAGIFGVASYGGKYVGDYQINWGGDEVFAQADHPATQVKGYNPTYPEVYGDPDTVKGTTILYTAGTTSQLVANRWLEAIGVKNDEVSMLNMEYAQTLQAFVTDQADFASLASPWCFEAADDGYVKVADLGTLDMPCVQSVIVPEGAYENKKEDIAKFLDCLYDANGQLMDDFELYVEWVKKWYETNGNEATEEDVRRECEIKDYVTWDSYQNVEYGAFHGEYADFLVSLEQISPEQAELVVDSVKTDILEMAVELHEAH